MLMVKANMKNQIKRLLKVLLLMISMCACFSTNAQETIQMKKEPNGVYTIPCEVNGLKLRFIFDTGASAVSISLTEATFMLKNGYLEDSDITGTTNVQTADGNIAENYTLTLKELKIGSVTLNNVQAVVSNGLDAPLLLGQSVLDKLGHWSIKEGNLVLNEISGREHSNDYTWNEIENMLKSNKSMAIDLLRELVRENDDYAAYLFLSNVVSLSEAGSWNLQDPEIVKAMEILENIENIYIDDKYWNYEKLIWFSLYRLNDTERAIRYIRQVENKKALSQEQDDHLWDKIFLKMGWGETASINSDLAEEIFSRGYFDAYETYATYLKQIKKQPIAAFTAYKRSADKGHIPSIVELGKCYLDGIGTPKNSVQGIKLLDTGSQKGNIEAIVELCSRYYFGDGLEQNFDKVLTYARLFGNSGEKEILNNAFTGIAYWNKKDYRMANQWLFPIGEMLLEPAGMNIKLSKVYNYGINRIDSEILSLVGQSYEKGLGCSLDFNKAYNYYKRLAEIEPAWGYGMLGDMFFLNELIETDAERAYQYYVLGANNDSGYCCFRLALMNYYGVGTSKNEIKAKEYKATAMKKGFKAEDFQF